MGRCRTDHHRTPSGGAAGGESLVCGVSAVGAAGRRRDGVRVSIVERPPLCGAPPRGDAVRAIGAAWRGVGRRGRTLTVGGLVACVVVTLWWVSASPVVVATGAVVAVLTVAALVDAVAHRLPNALVVLAAVPVIAAITVGWSPDLTRGALVGAAFLGGPLLVTHLVAPGGMGFGDVKAGTVLGAAVGLVAAPLALLALVLGLLLGAATASCGGPRPSPSDRRSSPVPCSPSLSVVSPASSPSPRDHRLTPEWRSPDDRDRPGRDRRTTRVPTRPTRPGGRFTRRRAPSGTPAARFEPGRVAEPRHRNPTWIVAGVLLVLLSALGGVLLFSSSDDRTEVLVAARDLDPGQPVERADLRVQRVAARRRRVVDAGRVGRRRRRPAPDRPHPRRHDARRRRCSRPPPRSVPTRSSSAPRSTPAKLRCRRSGSARPSSCVQVNLPPAGATDATGTAVTLGNGRIWAVESMAIGPAVGGRAGHRATSG